MNNQVIGIIGGSGFVGCALAKHLAKQYKVKILDVKPPADSRFDFIHCDIRDFSSIQQNLEGLDLVIHTAIVQIPLINEDKRLGYQVNFLGTQNVCRAVDENPRIKGMVLVGTWHTIGERELAGIVDEEYGFRPDKVEDRARLYALSKMAQEAAVRFYEEMSTKNYCIIRIGTALGETMPEKTAANLFINNGLSGKPITPYKQSMYRPMLYVDINDVCKAFEILAAKILQGRQPKSGNSLGSIANLYYPEPITILDLAEIVCQTIKTISKNQLNPVVQVVDQGKPLLFTEADKNALKVDLSRAKKMLEFTNLTPPKESIAALIKSRMMNIK